MDRAREWLETIHRVTGNTPGGDYARDILERLDAGAEAQQTLDDLQEVMGTDDVEKLTKILKAVSNALDS